MDAFNSLVSIVKDAMPIVQSGIPAVVGGFVSAMFLRGNTQNTEFEKIKAGKISEAIDDLVNRHELTLTELVKCKNLLKIAELADREYNNRTQETENNNDHQEFDFDWFLRFFEAAGNISNEDMQILWARILAGEVHNPGAFSLRSLETLRNMTKSEAALFQKIACLMLMEYDGSVLVYRSDYDGFTAHDTEINEYYGIGAREFAIMEECGLLSSINQDSYVTLIDGNAGIHNGNILLVLQASESNQNSETLLQYNSYMVTQTAIQLLSIVDAEPNDSYILDLGLILRKRYPDCIVRAYLIKGIENNGFSCDVSIDLLDDYMNEVFQ